MADEYIAKDYEGGAQATSLASSFTAGNTTFTVANGSTFPDGSSGPFVVVVDRGLATEEKFLIDTTTGANGVTFNIQQAGYDGTSAVNHGSGATVEHCLDAYTLKQANRYVNLQTTKGDLVGYTGSTTDRVAAGSNGLPLVANSSATAGINWAQLATAGIADDAVTAAKIATGAVGSDELASGAVTTAKITDLNVTTGKLADAAVTAGKIASDAVTTAKILDANVTTAKLASGSVTNAKLGLTELKLRRLSAESFSSPGYIQFDTEDADVDGFISATSPSIVVPSGASGLYAIGFTVSISATSNSAFVQIEQNGVLVPTSKSLFNGAAMYGGCTLYLAETDLIKFYFDPGASSKTVTCRLWMTRIMD